MESQSSPEIVEVLSPQESIEEDSSTDPSSISDPSNPQMEDLDSSAGKMQLTDSEDSRQSMGKSDNYILFNDYVKVKFYPVRLNKYPTDSDRDNRKLQNWFVLSLNKFLNPSEPQIELRSFKSDCVPLTEVEYSLPIDVPFLALKQGTELYLPADNHTEWHVVPLSVFHPAKEVSTPTIVVTSEDNGCKVIQESFEPEISSKRDRTKYFEPCYVPFYPARLPMLPPGVDAKKSKELHWYVTSLDGLLNNKDHVFVQSFFSEPTTDSDSSSSVPVPNIVYHTPVTVRFYQTTGLESPIPDSKVPLYDWKAIPLIEIRQQFKKFTSVESESSAELPPIIELPPTPLPSFSSSFQSPSWPGTSGLPLEPSLDEFEPDQPLCAAAPRLKRLSGGENIDSGPSSPKHVRDQDIDFDKPPTTLFETFRIYQYHHNSAIIDLEDKGDALLNFLYQQVGRYLYPAREYHVELINVISEFELKSPSFDPIREKFTSELESFIRNTNKGIYKLFDELSKCGISTSKKLCTTAGFAVKLLDHENPAAQMRDYSTIEITLSDESSEGDGNPDMQLSGPSRRVLYYGDKFQQFCISAKPQFDSKLNQMFNIVADIILVSSPDKNPLREDATMLQQMQELVGLMNLNLIAIKQSVDDMSCFIAGYVDSYKILSVAVLNELNSILISDTV